MEEFVDKLISHLDVARGFDCPYIDLYTSLQENGFDSLAMVAARVEIERGFNTFISDSDWMSFSSVKSIAEFLHAKSADAQIPSMIRPALHCHEILQPSTSLLSSGVMKTKIEIGMPLTGRNNLAEGPLLQRLGDLRWGHFSNIVGVQSRDIIDDEGNRLYPTFYYIEIGFPETRPMSSYGENDILSIVGDLSRYGVSILDGIFYVLPNGKGYDREATFSCVSEAVEAGVPAVRLSNVFVVQFSGAEWLKKSRPANPDFHRIPEVVDLPESITLVKEAERKGAFSAPPTGFVPMTEGPVSVFYNLVPDRDLNGAGLVYFANYPIFLDICERQVLGSGPFAIPEDLLNRRTLVERKSAYLNNANARDRLRISVEPWIELPSGDGPRDKPQPVRIFINFKMFRDSDQRIMMISTVKKIINCSEEEIVRLFQG